MSQQRNHRLSDAASDGSADLYDSGDEAADSDEECRELKLRFDAMQQVVLDEEGRPASQDEAGIPDNGLSYKLSVDDGVGGYVF